MPPVRSLSASRKNFARRNHGAEGRRTIEDYKHGIGHHVRFLVSSLHFVSFRASFAHFMPWFFRLYRGNTDGQDFVAVLLVIACFFTLRDTRLMPSVPFAALC